MRLYFFLNNSDLNCLTVKEKLRVNHGAVAIDLAGIQSLAQTNPAAWPMWMSQFQQKYQNLILKV